MNKHSIYIHTVHILYMIIYTCIYGPASKLGFQITNQAMLQFQNREADDFFQGLSESLMLRCSTSIMCVYLQAQKNQHCIQTNISWNLYNKDLELCFLTQISPKWSSLRERNKFICQHPSFLKHPQSADLVVFLRVP